MPATTTTTTTTSTTTEAALADELMTSNVPPLASLGSVFDRLYRISVNEQVQQQPLELEEEESTVPAPLQIQMQAAASYQVAETLADLNEEERARYGPMLSQQPTASKLNIVDLYPMKPADFQPIIKVDNEELLRQRTIFTQPENAAEYKQNLMPNEVELQLRPLAAATSATTAAATVASDFTGKLLAEQDDLITEIERKFRLPESTTTTAKPTTAAAAATRLAAGNTFLDRRVKKSFEFPLQHRASDVMALPHIDFANTKFNTDAGEESKTAQAQAASHPEFSTTKFYNSKELYNEMLLHSKRKLMKPTAAATATTATTTTATTTTTTAAAAAATKTNAATTASVVASEATTSARVTLTPAATTFDSNTAAITTTTASVTESPPRKQQQQLKRAKLLLKALKPPAAAEKLEVVATKVKITAAAAAAVSSTPSPLQAINLAKSSLKPIARPRILSPLQEKINSLDCDIVAVPQDAHLWRGNETHELLLPLVTTEHCTPGERCTPNVLTWEGTAEIQSGDILIVEINDAMLNIAHEQNNTNSQSAAHAAQVYQVTRPGHDHCDVTEGVLLDITPLVVDGRKLVTLYDKDLTEGINMLIVVSELWGAQCVRLKVTTKTDNCGEGADCSGKGVCYSDAAMEEYECQCCSGFAGAYCEEIDACNPSPCTNNGICVDLSQGHEGNSYQCLCPYGYAGKNCQYESDPCNPADCMNGGSCVGNSTHFRCDCTPGFTGPLCQHSLNECESSPCLHGICVDQEDGFRCFCQPGFAGELCNFEYNECESNPCQNSGECIDHIGSYECRCTKGYTGNRCQIKVDFCANKPCPEGHHCIDHGNDFSCECPGGRNGPDCNQMPRTYFQQCSVNPCTHGGTCWSSGDSFYCACRPGYTGTMCEDEFVVETVVSSSEFIVDDANARNFNDKTFGSSVVLKSPIELHNAYFAAGVLAAAIFIVAIVVTICHCKVNQTYRKFSTRSSSFIPILGFSRRPKMQGKLNKHWLSGKGLNAPAAAAAAGAAGAGGAQRDTNNCNPQSQSTRHLPPNAHSSGSGGSAQGTLGGQLHERPFQRHLAMNLENDMYYTVDFSENSQHSPLIQ
ncbi:wry [Drosophila busckii]|uniref:Wry n=1 Tax=Drosophila busckii TaxID=30019 RepID=A0A0M4EDM8_DROBS|nr:wry [Drosophila busckii]